MAPLFAPVVTAVLGAAGMYFFDPDRGRRRRVQLRDKSVHVARKAGDMVVAGGKDLKHRMQGSIHGLASGMTESEPSDAVLTERVRAKLGRYVAHPAAIEVASDSGDVVVSGHVLRHEHRKLVDAIRSVPGVRMLNDRLIVHTTADGVSALQGGKPRRGERSELFQDVWAPGTRLAGTATGTAMAVLALASGGLRRLALGGAGTLLLVRSLTNRPLRRLSGSTESGRDLHPAAAARSASPEIPITS